jgi:hypothetical protein
MKTVRLIILGTFVLVITFGSFLNSYAQKDQQRSIETKQTAIEAAQQQPKPAPKRNFVTMADFYLKDGKLVFGKLLADDRNKITVERIDDAKVVVSTYSKLEVDSRTINTRRIPEYKYYLDLAEYFSARTWDFRNDPDDFIQAIRCCEKAKQLLAENHSRHKEKIEQINNKIKQLEADRQLWKKQTESRAALKRLEFEAEFDVRLKELGDKITANNGQIEDVIIDIQQDRQKLQDATNAIAADISHQLDMLSERVDYNRRIINYILYRWRRFPPHGWTLPKDLDSER